MIDWTDPRMKSISCEFSNASNKTKYIAPFARYLNGTFSYCEKDSCWANCRIIQGKKTKHDSCDQPVPNGVRIKIWMKDDEVSIEKIRPAEDWNWDIVTYYQVMETVSEDNIYDAVMHHEISNKLNKADQHEPGAKLDQGKPRVSLVLDGFALALLEVSKVGTMGSIKYSDNGWMEVPDGIKRYSDASGRHQLYKASGETHDPESKLLHQAHKAWNELAVLELMLREERE
jgi:hypothetical protein